MAASNPSRSSAERFRRWLKPIIISRGIQTLILAPLALLMGLATLGGLVGFVLATNTTRDRILDEQLAADVQRLGAALSGVEREVADAAEALARAPGLESALAFNDVLELDRQALLVRERFQIDQVLIERADGRALVNIAAQSYLSAITAERPTALRDLAARQSTGLVRLGQSWLLVAAVPVMGEGSRSAEQVATIFTLVNLSEAIERYTRATSMGVEATIVPLGMVFPGQNTSSEGYRLAWAEVRVGEERLKLSLRRSESEINAILGSGLKVVLVANTLTLLLVLAIGLYLSKTLTRPIRKLARVASAVAAGDLTVKANLIGNDEIGQLGATLDQATSTIADLLDQQVRSAGELRAILESIADGVLAVDAEARVVILNPAAAAILGHEPEALIGQPLVTIVEGADPLLAPAMEQVVGQIRSELLDPDAQPTEENVAIGPRVVRLQSAPIQAAGGRAGAVVVLQDITRVVESEKAQSEFIGTASHELRTPLASIKGYLDIFHLMGTDNLSEQQRSFLQVIKRQADTMTQLVNDLLEMARIERGAIRASRNWVAPATALEEVAGLLREQAAQRRVTLTVETAPDLPALWIDAMQLRRILTNLLSNAVKYVYAGGRVWARAYEEDERLIFEIEDNGVGIRAADQPKIFERFFRSENPLMVEAGGTGLGLAITRALVEHNRGAISFRSEEGRGTTFRISLPTTVGAGAEESPSALAHGEAI